MTNYTKTTDFAAKDALPSGNSAKIVKGSEIDTEFNNIATASATKANANAAALTGTTTFETISDGTIAITAFVDEDNMASDSATLLPTQQSVKAYVDSQVTAQDLDVTDGSTSIDIDLDSESLGILGGTGIDSTALGTGVTLAIDSTVATLTGSQTLSNKTLSTPVVSGNLTTDGLLDGRDVATDGAKLDGIESGATADQTAAEIKTAYESNADTNAFTDADESKLDGIEASADVTDTANVTAAGALMDSELTSEASVKALNQGVATTDSPTFAGLTTTADVSFGDNDKAIFGAGSDLEIFHDGSHSYVRDSGTGHLKLQGTDVRIQSADGAENFLVADLDGAVKLYNNDAQKFQTTSTGIDVTGTVVSDGLTVDGVSTVRAGDTTNASLQSTAGDLVLKAGADDVILQTGGSGGEAIQFVDNAGTLYFNADMETGDISFYEDTGTTPKMVWDSSAESLGIGTTAPERTLHVDSSGVQIGALISSTSTIAARLSLMDANTTSSSKVGIGATGDNLGLYAGGSARATLDSSGNFLVGTTIATAKITSEGSSGNLIAANLSSGSSGDCYYANVSSTTQNLVRFEFGGSQVGRITTNGTTTTYNTSSDQRLKKNIVEAPSASDDIDAIQVRSFDWKADGSHQRYGMVAQELLTVAPEAVSQPEDPEEMMGVDYSKLVPMLVKEIQSLRARVAQLEN